MAAGDVTLGAGVNTFLGRDFLFLVSSGQIDGMSLVYKFGQILALSTTELDVNIMAAVVTKPTSAAVASVAYSGNDNTGAAGAHKVVVQGLDSSWEEVEEEVTLAPAGSPVTTTQTFIRVYRAYVSEGGTYQQTYASPYGTNHNDITVSVGGNAQVMIYRHTGQTLTTHYTVPSGKTAYFVGAEAQVDASQNADLSFWQRRDADDATTPFTQRRVIQTGSAIKGQIAYHGNYAVTFPEKTDLWWSAVGSAAGTQVEISYTLLLVDD